MEINNIEQILKMLSDLFTIDKLLICFLLLNVIDYITGFLKAFKTRTVKSRYIRDGVISTVSELFAIIFGIILDQTLGTGILLSTSIKSLLIFKESVSIMENLNALGIELPEAISKYLYDFKDNISNKKE